MKRKMKRRGIVEKKRKEEGNGEEKEGEEREGNRERKKERQIEEGSDRFCFSRPTDSLFLPLEISISLCVCERLSHARLSWLSLYIVSSVTQCVPSLSSSLNLCLCLPFLFLPLLLLPLPLLCDYHARHAPLPYLAIAIFTQRKEWLCSKATFCCSAPVHNLHEGKIAASPHPAQWGQPSRLQSLKVLTALACLSTCLTGASPSLHVPTQICRPRAIGKPQGEVW